MDPIRDHITQLLKEHAGGYDLRQISANLAFIIKHVAGPKVEARQISVTFTETLDEDGDWWGDTLTVSVHMEEGNLKVIASYEMDDGTEIIKGLEREVNKRVQEILERDGDDALDDDEQDMEGKS